MLLNVGCPYQIQMNLPSRTRPPMIIFSHDEELSFLAILKNLKNNIGIRKCVVTLNMLNNCFDQIFIK